MATPKRTKSSTTKAENDLVQEEAVKTKEAINKKAEEKVKKVVKKFEKDELIPCKSVTAGKLIYISKKSGLKYIWSNYGDIEYIEYSDLLSLKSQKSPFIYKPLFIIQDEDLSEQWSLDEIYSTFLSITNPEDFFDLSPNQIREKLEVAPDGLRDLVKSTAITLINSEELYDLRKIKVLDQILGTELKLMIE